MGGVAGLGEKAYAVEPGKVAFENDVKGYLQGAHQGRIAAARRIQVLTIERGRWIRLQSTFVGLKNAPSWRGTCVTKRIGARCWKLPAPGGHLPNSGR